MPAGVMFVDNRNGTGTLGGTPTASGVYQHQLYSFERCRIAVDADVYLDSESGSGNYQRGQHDVHYRRVQFVYRDHHWLSGFRPQRVRSIANGVTFTDNHNGTATLSGNPSAGGVYSISFTASNGIGSNAVQSFTLTVNQAPAITSANNTTLTAGSAGSFTVSATGYPTPSLSETGALPTGVSFVDNHNGSATLSGTPSAGGVFSITFTASERCRIGSNADLHIDGDQASAITSASNTTFVTGTSGSFTVTTTGYPTSSISETGSLPAGVTFVDNHNGTGTLSGSATAGGVYNISFTAANGIGSNSVQSFTLTVNQAPAITSANTTTFTVGASGSFTVTTTGYPTPSLSETGALPSGVTFADNHNGTGTLSGTPTANGVFSLSITASNGIGSNATQAFTLTVNQAPAITSANNTTFTVGTAGSFTVSTTGYPTPSLSETGALPGGVTFTDNHNGTATLSGTPSANGVFSLSITASNGIGSPATQAFTLTVNQAPAITSANNATFTAGTAGSFTVARPATRLPA